MAQLLDDPLELSQDASLPLDALARNAPHLPLVFASAPTVPAAERAPLAERAIPAERAAPADRPAPLVRPRGRLRIGWYEIAVLALILSCAALAVTRLMWAIQP